MKGQILFNENSPYVNLKIEGAIDKKKNKNLKWLNVRHINMPIFKSELYQKFVSLVIVRI